MSSAATDFLSIVQDSAATDSTFDWWLRNENYYWNLEDDFWKPIKHKGFVIFKGKLHYLYDENPRSVKKMRNTGSNPIKHLRKTYLKSGLRYQNW